MFHLPSGCREKAQINIPIPAPSTLQANTTAIRPTTWLWRVQLFARDWYHKIAAPNPTSRHAAASSFHCSISKFIAFHVDGTKHNSQRCIETVYFNYFSTDRSLA